MYFCAMIDLRSDTVTKPTKPMLEAMMQAEVGDNVYKEDASINALEQYAADLFGMEAALFCPSGTMTNQIALKLHTQPGDEVICDFNAHIYQYEGGGIAFNSGASVRCLQTVDGTFTANDVLDHIHDATDIHHPLTKLISVENTCNRSGGTIWDFEKFVGLRALCNERGFGFHLDGARLFNALVETDRSPEDYGALFDSISICLSKGLGAPVGSLLLGSANFIKRALRVQKLFGGVMRQAGYLASAGLYALQHNVTRLKEDNLHAKRLGSYLEGLLFVERVVPVNSNIVIFYLKDGIAVSDLLEILEQQDILAIGMGNGIVRFVTHLHITEKMIEGIEEKLATINSNYDLQGKLT